MPKLPGGDSKERCTSLYGVPTMFIAQLDHPAFSTYQPGFAQDGIMAGAPCPVEVMRQVIEKCTCARSPSRTA